MPKCSTQRNADGVEILFDEASHRYTSIIGGREIEYTSGTTFIHRFFPAFDPDGAIARRIAEREGVTAAEIQQRWRDNADRACRFGTKIHETVEDVLRGDMLRNRPYDARERATMAEAVRLARLILSRLEVLGVERIVFDPSLKIAGTMDLLARSKKDGRVWILDHKTNQRIETDNRWGRYGLPPIANVPDTNYHHYSLQLNLYERLLAWRDRRGIGKAIFHITAGGTTPYMLEEYPAEIEKMIAATRSEP